MKKIRLGKSNLEVPEIAVGCMRFAGMEQKNLNEYIDFCVNNGLVFFDHADIYGDGVSESMFAEAVKELGLKREDLQIQSKCGIVREPFKMYDFSKQHILEAVDNILTRLQTDYLDVLLLHRPDALMEPEEVAEAFDILEASGKVRNFGVSNQKPMQMELLKKYVRQEFIVNQLQLSIPFSNMIAQGIELNTMSDYALDRDGSVLDYCRLKDITIQTWSPFQGIPKGVFIGDWEKYPGINRKLEEIAKKYETTPTAIATAWILRHPAHMQVVAGTTKIARMQEILAGSNIQLTRAEWYDLYMSVGHSMP